MDLSKDQIFKLTKIYFNNNLFYTYDYNINNIFESTYNNKSKLFNSLFVFKSSKKFKIESVKEIILNSKSDFEPKCFILALIYLSRILSYNIKLNDRNKLNFYLISLLVAVKYLDDNIYENIFFLIYLKLN